tara:strand:- start:55 stop:177 length:123 start_codon:yes stop_codon:yes gene_type:complete
VAAGGRAAGYSSEILTAEVTARRVTMAVNLISVLVFVFYL